MRVRRSGCGPSPPATTEGVGRRRQPREPRTRITRSGYRPRAAAQPPRHLHQPRTGHGQGPAAVWPATVWTATVWTDARESESPGLSRWLIEAAFRVGVSIRSVDGSDGGGKTSVFACDGGLGLPGCSCACGLLWATARVGGENQRTGLGAAQMPGGRNGTLIPVRAGISGPGVAGTARGAAQDAASRSTRR